MMENAAYWRAQAHEAMQEAARRPWWSPARRGWEARAEECNARADRLDPADVCPGRRGIARCTQEAGASVMSYPPNRDAACAHYDADLEVRRENCRVTVLELARKFVLAVWEVQTIGVIIMCLDLDVLRQANMARLPLFRDANGRVCHQPDGSDWALSAWCNAVLGELGEAANLIKKIERGDFTLEQKREELAKEFADVLTYLDLLAFRSGVDLGRATIDKFNEVSRRVGAPVYLCGHEFYANHSAAYHYLGLPEPAVEPAPEAVLKAQGESVRPGNALGSLAVAIAKAEGDTASAQDEN